jgi:hypothetical protein
VDGFGRWGVVDRHASPVHYRQDAAIIQRLVDTGDELREILDVLADLG